MKKPIALFDKVNYWSEIKLEIVRKYASAYSTILTNQKRPSFDHIYIDGFAGPGVNISKQTGDWIPGSPTNALLVEPPFKEYHLVDLDGNRAKSLRNLTKGIDNVTVYHGDCNKVLLSEVFPKAKYGNYRRALCLLDPYGLHLDWEVVETAGKMNSIEIFLNFPVMDMNMNVLWKNPEKVSPTQADRMNAFWGDESWKDAAYKPLPNLFGEDWYTKVENDDVANAFRKRLEEKAGFEFVPVPIPMRNHVGATVYYLFFASQNLTGATIVTDIFSKYRERGKI